MRSLLLFMMLALTGCAGSGAAQPPHTVGQVDLQGLGGLTHGEHLEAAVAVDVALLDEAVDVLGLLVIRQVGRQVDSDRNAQSIWVQNY